jgi:hypothetical protein
MRFELFVDATEEQIKKDVRAYFLNSFGHIIEDEYHLGDDDPVDEFVDLLVCIIDGQTLVRRIEE